MVLGTGLAASLLLTMGAAVALGGSATLRSGTGPVGGLGGPGASDGRVETSIDGTTWQPASVIAPLPEYATLPGTAWVSRAAPFGAEVVHYRIRFTLPAAFAETELAVTLHADGAARVLLNGTELGAQPQIDTPANHQGPPDGFGTDDENLFVPGENVLSFAVATFGGPSGLDFIGGVSFEEIPNRAPSADAGGPYEVVEGASIALAGSGVDPERGPLAFTWDLDGDGTFEAAGAAPTFVGADGPATQAVVVRVCDVEPACTTSSAIVTITEAPVTSASGVLTGVLDDLEALLPTGSADADAHLERAIRGLSDALEGGHWADESHLDAASGQTVFSRLKFAINALAGITEPESARADAQAAIAAIAAAAQGLAATELAEGGSARAEAVATDQIARGDALVADGRPELAVDRYRKAWTVLAG